MEQKSSNFVIPNKNRFKDEDIWHDGYYVNRMFTLSTLGFLFWNPITLQGEQRHFIASNNYRWAKEYVKRCHLKKNYCYANNLCGMCAIANFKNFKEFRKTTTNQNEFKLAIGDGHVFVLWNWNDFNLVIDITSEQFNLPIFMFDYEEAIKWFPQYQIQQEFDNEEEFLEALDFPPEYHPRYFNYEKN